MWSMKMEVVSEALGATGATLDAEVKGFQGMKMGSFAVPMPGSIVNTRVQNVTVNSADLVGTLDGPTAAWHVTMYWGLVDQGTNASTWAYTNVIGWYMDVHDLEIVGGVGSLLPDTTYYYAFNATNHAALSMWDSTSGVLRTLSPPAVDNGTGASSTNATEAILTGTLTNGSFADAYIYWGDNDGGTDKAAWDNVISLGVVGMGPFSGVANDTLHGVQYYYRCYVTNAAGDDWADGSVVIGPGVDIDAVLLTTDFTGRTVSGDTAQNITWSVTAVSDPGDMTAIDEESSGFLAGLKPSRNQASAEPAQRGRVSRASP